MNKLCSLGLIAGGMLMGMGALYMLECKQSKSFYDMVDEAKDTIDDMMN